MIPAPCLYRMQYIVATLLQTQFKWRLKRIAHYVGMKRSSTLHIHFMDFPLFAQDVVTKLHCIVRDESFVLRQHTLSHRFLIEMSGPHCICTSMLINANCTPHVLIVTTG